MNDFADTFARTGKRQLPVGARGLPCAVGASGVAVERTTSAVWPCGSGGGL